MAIAQARKMTLEEFAALPEGPPHFEFENGELIPMTSPTRRHQKVVAAYMRALTSVIESGNLGEVVMELDVYLPDGRVYIPDLVFVAKDRMHLFDPGDDKLHGVPDLVIEVVSQGASRDRVHKFRAYQENGVPWYWVTDSETLAVEEYRLGGEGYVRVSSTAAGEVFRPALFPGLGIDLVTLIGVTHAGQSAAEKGIRPEGSEA